jgi:hypothetical protein
MNVSKGQIWKAMDKRVERRIKVIETDAINATVFTIDEEGVQVGPPRKCLLSRFNGKSRGYAMVQQEPEAPQVKKCIIAIGQQWKERHSRNLRIVEIVGIEGDYVTLMTVRIQAPDGKELGTQKAKPTKAHINRFSGKRSGYKKVY